MSCFLDTLFEYIEPYWLVFALRNVKDINQNFNDMNFHLPFPISAPKVILSFFTKHLFTLSFKSPSKHSINRGLPDMTGLPVVGSIPKVKLS